MKSGAELQKRLNQVATQHGIKFADMNTIEGGLLATPPIIKDHIKQLDSVIIDLTNMLAQRDSHIKQLVSELVKYLPEDERALLESSYGSIPIAEDETAWFK